MENPFINCSTEKEAKTMFHKLSFKFHPDINDGKETEMKELINYYREFQNKENNTNTSFNDFIDLLKEDEYLNELFKNVDLTKIENITKGALSILQMIKKF